MPPARVPGHFDEDRLRRFTIGEPERLTRLIEIVPYDPSWPGEFERHRQVIVGALGDRVRLLEHAGSTSVPGLAAKPRIDIVLAVPDSSNESAYVPDLEAAGYVLRIREPEWYEHRVFIRHDSQVNVHTFSEGCVEITRMIAFRDWLRADPEDRDYYQRTKCELASRRWDFVQQYADAKTAVVEEIISRALAGKS